ncbi:MAG: dienelactone hydrolase family protein [Anaerolineales bacterium]|jgi:dienelactone hydrolase
MKINSLRREIVEFLKFEIPNTSAQFKTLESVDADGYYQLRISYDSEEGDEIPAYLLLPEGKGLFGAVLVHHQHASQRQFGKSEICGLVGDPLQAFGPVLARQGIVVLAPDSICFEDRRKNRTGTEPDEAADIAQHFNEMCYRLLRGDTLMRKVLSDSAQGISLLLSHPQVDSSRIGILGHSYGGNTVLFHGALDQRIRFACSSGAACSYRYKMANQVGIEMAEVIPGFATRFEIPNLVACFSSRPLLVLSATEDKFSFDADQMVEAAKALNSVVRLEHKRYQGGHALTQERLDDIVNWLIEQAGGD